MSGKLVLKKTGKIAGILLIVLVIVCGLFLWMVSLKEPDILDQEAYVKLKRDSIANGWKSGNNWIHKNEYGLYEMYLEGKPYERGYMHGLLAQELVVRQEDHFVDRLNMLIPSRLYQIFLKQIVVWLNKDLDENISDEYKQEIYGVSQFASSKYDYIAPKYQRILNYHGAHDIGHAMQNMNLVACSSFGAWNGYTADSSLLIARNFDFYAGDDFAQEKIILFVKPDSGYKLMMVTWGGFTGITSGMNEHGLTVTLNAAPSKLPSSSATPITLISRQILQYAKNIDEAFAIAAKSKSFVSESFLIGSALDHKAVLIEKTPDTTILYTSPKDEILSTNHFQSPYFMNDPVNVKHKEESATVFRYNRLQQLLSREKVHTPASSVVILRNRLGWNDTNIGLSNENTVNQLVAHHSVIFLPEKKGVWVSSNPYQMGTYVYYDLNKIFGTDYDVTKQTHVYEASQTIAADSFLTTPAYADYVFYKVILQKMQRSSFEAALTVTEILKFEASNPEYFDTHVHIAQYYMARKAYIQALPYLKKAQSKTIPRKEDRDKIVNLIEICNAEL
ncbi:C45 family autoproteolytic acyltransferase/hydolase [Cytophaga aurantiaca]|uniref:C45 family autoproteolytic acyltransferase/hydolase n=1 Tax=Cytophaga aurantiaca TaxID=29530 RepID=UPI0003A8F3DA|nr:C45 family peptidase [Cytophaga aurantiaca]